MARFRSLSSSPSPGRSPPPSTGRTARGSCTADRGHHAPRLLPDGRRFLFLKHRADPEERAILVGSVDGEEPREIVKSRFAGAWVEPGLLRYIRGATLLGAAERSAIAAAPRRL